jgi:hypothetical protein
LRCRFPCTSRSSFRVNLSDGTISSTASGLATLAGVRQCPCPPDRQTEEEVRSLEEVPARRPTSLAPDRSLVAQSDKSLLLRGHAEQRANGSPLATPFRPRGIGPHHRRRPRRLFAAVMSPILAGISVGFDRKCSTHAEFLLFCLCRSCFYSENVHLIQRN